MTGGDDRNPGEAPRNLPLLRNLLATVPNRLSEIPADHAAEKSSPEQWSRKQELGHLIDSAANNHQRIVRAQLEESPAMPGYDGDAWVAMHGYQSREWQSLIELWGAGNSQLLAAAEGAAAEAWPRTLTVGGSEIVTLRFVFDDYVEHMLGHLGHIGLDVEQLRSASSETEYPEKPAETRYVINQLIKRRWSPRAFEDRQVEREKILTMLEAARWAPSCFNEQPWRYLVFDGSDAQALERARACLVEGNAWALSSPVLMLSVARDNFEKNGKLNRTAPHDVGLASENLVLQAVELGLVTHQMAGFDDVRARTEFRIPEAYTPMAMIAVGYPYKDDLEALPEKLRKSEMGERSRRPLREIGFAGEWEKPYAE